MRHVNCRIAIQLSRVKIIHFGKRAKQEGHTRVVARNGKHLLQSVWRCVEKYLLADKMSTNTLCSRNFQNVKLGLTLSKFDNLTVTPILREIEFW